MRRDHLLLALPLLLPALAAACSGTIQVGNTSSSSSGSGGNASSSVSTGGSSSVSTTSVTSTSVSSTGSTGGGGQSSTTGTGGSTSTSIQPPPPGPPHIADGFGGTTFAIGKLYLGDTDRDGTPDQMNGWKQYGYNIDDQVSTATSTGLCQPRNNASPVDVYPDGNGGIDNSFGKNILPIFLGLAADLTQKENDAITSGQFTLMLDLQQLGSGADYNPILTRLYRGADLGHAALFDGTDVWPVDPALLSNPLDVTSTTVSFPGAYLVSNTWVGPAQGDVPLDLHVNGFLLTIPISHAVVTMNLDGAHQSATNGTIAGVVSTDTFIAAITALAGHFDPSLCSGSTIDSIVQQVGQASDIMKDGSQDPNAVCDGISIGIGFDTAQRVQLGAVAPATPPSPDPCNP